MWGNERFLFSWFIIYNLGICHFFWWISFISCVYLYAPPGTSYFFFLILTVVKWDSATGITAPLLSQQWFWSRPLEANTSQWWKWDWCFRDVTRFKRWKYSGCQWRWLIGMFLRCFLFYFFFFGLISSCGSTELGVVVYRAHPVLRFCLDLSLSSPIRTET